MLNVPTLSVNVQPSGVAFRACVSTAAHPGGRAEGELSLMAIDHNTPPPPPPPPAAGRVRGLGHIVLHVADLERSLVFYRDVLGWPLLPVPSGPHRFAGFRAGETHHDLMLIEVGAAATPVPTGRRLGLYHFGVKVGDSDDD